MELHVSRGGHVEPLLRALVLQKVSEEAVGRFDVVAVEGCRAIGGTPQHAGHAL